MYPRPHRDLSLQGRAKGRAFEGSNPGPITAQLQEQVMNGFEILSDAWRDERAVLETLNGDPLALLVALEDAAGLDVGGE
jgi:hypothetical protein